MSTRSFGSPAAFASFLANAQTQMRRHHRSVLERAAQLVEREAKAAIGNYQPAAAPFAKWAELADSTKADRVQQGFTENDPLLRTGSLRDSIGHQVEANAHGGEAVIGSASEVAVFQEMGTKSIPPRSYLGSAAVRNADQIVSLLGGGAVAALTDDGGSSINIDL